MTLNTLSDRIKSEGAAYFDDIESRREEETLHLEFKSLSHSGGDLKKDDKKLIAKAVTGLANAEGGVLIIGIATLRVDGVDVATEKRPIKQLSRTTNLIRASIPEMLSPQHPRVEVFEIDQPGKADEGFIVVAVPASLERPHYSNVHHQYFRRGSDGTRVMEHSEVRELMFASREGQLELAGCVLAEPILLPGQLFFSLRYTLVIRNVGQVPASAPYVRIAQNGWSGTDRRIGVRPSANGHIGFYATRDEPIHAQDERHFAYIQTGLDFRRTGALNFRDAIRIVRKDGWHALRMFPSSHLQPLGTDIPDVNIRASGLYGAENATAKEFDLTIDKIELLRLFCEVNSLS
ncbi:AlbA family DNA-binding domain-containing protein [Bradyrhizobium sp. SZCCHNR1075]|uniref:AlbA family DNA-binding domain-containing protein n=1 Tax=Bradyrhizobium sp. SZCCHNR1075 TaxID=3057362 RepID=UPI0028ECA25C|nr:ATP-binding protein [Bradyrhizobium sp. SZCCHNR1075]